MLPADNVIKTVSVTIEEVRNGTINPDPIGQRPPVSTGLKKPRGIIDSVINGYSIGVITVRDIWEDDENQKIYENVKWLVMDGGNRIRAMRDFKKGDFTTTDGKTYLSLNDEERELFDKTELLFQVYTCDNHEATEIFRRLNTVTPVNQIEMIMANDTAQITKEIRTRVKTFKEYGSNSTQHKIFKTELKDDGKDKSLYWNTPVNPRRKWDEYVAIVFIKVMGGGNVAAGLDEIEDLVNSGPVITSRVKKLTDTFFNDALEVIDLLDTKMNANSFGAFQAVWFELLERNKVFAISDHKKFGDEFFKAHTSLTGTSKLVKDKYEDDIRNFKTGERGSTNIVRELVKTFARSAIKYPSNPSQQQEVAKLYLAEMDIDEAILYKDTRRTVSKDEKFEMLVSQDFRCAIDGEPLSINDAIFGHDTPWSKGGVIEDGAIIRKEHNVAMGALMNLDEYRNHLEFKRNHDACA